MKKVNIKDYSFIQVGSPVIPKGKREVVYIIEILNEKIITTNGTYQKENLNSVVHVATTLMCFSLN